MTYSSYSKYGKRRRTTTGYTRYKKRYTRAKSSRRSGMMMNRTNQMTITPNNQIARMLPGTFRTSKSWLRAAPGSLETKNHDVFAISVDQILATTSDLEAAWQDTTGMANFNAIPQNTTKNGRIGRKISIKRFSCRFKAAFTSAASDNRYGPIFARWIVFIDTQTNGNTPNEDAVLDNTHIGNYNAGPPVVYPQDWVGDSFQNLDNAGRFRILSDRRYKVDPVLTFTTGVATSSGATYNALMDKMSISLKGMPMEYSGVDGAENEIRTNSIWSFVTYFRGATASVNPGVANFANAVTIKTFLKGRVAFVDP